ncbi:lipid-A-disaccharide synthase [Marivirga sp. S37H4]|uniref:Lipid-A-disaccharide synthase n=1 Tax=Marivirga aurantiaca TaxID=2802615 RepID=A0A934WY89_9BACT|nr:lipid-A-disaccharide synthase [Marivirga aurantiaca]MBK6265364.1 lipid-A-disaccharide synthase [Marivirga aurantiaca]
MKYYIIAGERSGDLHGGNLIKALKNADPEAEVRCWGGEAMQKAGADLVVHYKEMAFMGFWEVFTHLNTIQKRIKFCKKDILDYNPDALILIDYAGFNMRMAKFAHQNNIPTHYYISPKIWAWNQNRAFKIKKSVDYMYVILPFEKEFYRKFDYEVDYVGNPLLDAIKAFEPDQNFVAKQIEKPIIAILPGSRKQEVLHMLAKLKAIVPHFPDYHFIVAGVSNLEATLYETVMNLENVSLVYDQAYDVLNCATAALVTSGTATLETALFEVPQVVCYKTSGVSYAIAKRLIKVDYISLVNLILNKEAVRELIQQEFTVEKLKKELHAILPGQPKREQVIQDYKQLKEILGDMETSQTSASLIYERVKS